MVLIPVNGATCLTNDACGGSLRAESKLLWIVSTL
jgi:hypothetical protein